MIPKRAFRYHFNRINMQRGDPRVWTVHTRGQCIQTEQIRCKVPVESRYQVSKVACVIWSLSSLRVCCHRSGGVIVCSIVWR